MHHRPHPCLSSVAGLRVSNHDLIIIHRLRACVRVYVYISHFPFAPQIDDILSEHMDRAKDRRKDITMLASVFVVMAAMIGMHALRTGNERAFRWKITDIIRAHSRTAMDLVSRYRILNRTVPDDRLEVASQYIVYHPSNRPQTHTHTHFNQIVPAAIATDAHSGAFTSTRVCKMYRVDTDTRRQCLRLHSVLHSVLHADGAARPVRTVGAGNRPALSSPE